jgi:excisionase family DNA binding protein
MGASETTGRGVLRPNEAAEFLGLARQTLARWRHEGSGPRYSLAGRLVRYHVADLERWLESRAVTSTAEARVAGLLRREVLR